MTKKKLVRFTAWVNINVYFYLSINGNAKHKFMVFWFFHFDWLDLSVRWQHIHPNAYTKYKRQQQHYARNKIATFHVFTQQQQRQKNEFVSFVNKYFMLCYYDDVNKDARALTQFIRKKTKRKKWMRLCAVNRKKCQTTEINIYGEWKRETESEQKNTLQMVSSAENCSFSHSPRIAT